MRTVIVGASLAGLKTATALRDFEYDGEIVLIGDEVEAPYDRPPLSKAVLTDGLTVDRIALGEPSELDVDLRLGRRATALDPAIRTVTLDDGQRLSYDALVVATGATPRRLPWRDLAGVCYLRTFADAVALRDRLRPGRRAVVVGGGFIGAEAASAARRLGLDVTILEANRAPLSRVLGDAVGSALGGLHERNGVDLRCGAEVTDVEGDETVTGVRLATGEVVSADVVIVGIGAVPVTDWLATSGLTVDDGLVCDEHCRALGTTDVYAVGDVARWMNPFYGETMRVEHWTNAVEQAAAVAQAITGDPEPYAHVPYVWSHQYDHQCQMVGRIRPDHTPRFVGTPTDGAPFVALYADGEALSGAVVLDLPRAIPKLKRLLSRRATIDEALSATATLLPLPPIGAPS